MSHEIEMTSRPCDRCNATGVYWKNGGVCYGCGGTGIAERETTASRERREAWLEWHTAQAERMAEVRKIARRVLREQGCSHAQARQTLRAITLLGEDGR